MAGNQQAMREALLKASGVLTEAAHHNLAEEYINECIALIHAALTAPPRNCEIGTPAEQSVRYEKFCFEHRTMERCCEDCPLKSEPCCELAWAQLPYEEAANADADT